MKIIAWFKSSTRQRGIALIMVVGALALMTILMVAMFSVTQTEYRATQNYVATLSAKQLADMSVNIVQAQIQNGQNVTVGAKATIHTTQPGVVQVFANSGTFQKALKLYSSSRMVETSQPALLADAPPSDWSSAANAGRYVDLNEPVLRPSPGGTASVFFPIIDPRAAYNFIGAQSAPGQAGVFPSTKVEGFDYDVTTTWGDGKVTYNDGKTVVLPSGANDPTQLRLAMPVEWLYVLQDGTLGTLDPGDGKTFIPATGGNPATATNPIVGRMAFWTDDESCKVNVNTASEPTFMGTPYYYHDRDRRWAHYPAASGEYQRYPGHPATVALSAILAPGYRLDAYAPDNGLSAADVVNIKDTIYSLAPKIAGGNVPNGKNVGSEAGTIPFVMDDLNAYNDHATSTNVDLTNALNERLYASVDEMLFQDEAFDSNTGRTLQQIPFPGGSRNLFDRSVLERSRFFLTAHSRSPEFSIQGLPRVCMWPEADESMNTTYGGEWRTSYDYMAALCATLNNTKGAGPGSAAGSYYFRRAAPHSSTADSTGTAPGYASTTLQRNSVLLNYLLQEMTQLSYPVTTVNKGSNYGSSTNFQLKYGTDNVRQLAVELFDYIRCVNLYDGVLARTNNGIVANGQSGFTLYQTALHIANERHTYTNQRITAPQSTGVKNGMGSANSTGSADANVLPGHGTVTPAVWSVGGTSYMGLGRFFTLSEIGFRLLCTADGAPDDYSVGLANNNPGYNMPFTAQSGGTSAVRTNATVPNVGVPGNAVPAANSDVYPAAFNIKPSGNARWWSNFPPLTAGSQNNPPMSLLTAYGCDGTKAATGAKPNYRHPFYHPAFDPSNWNLTLQPDTPLQPTEKRIQSSLDLELFCAALGWTKMYPEFTIVIKNLNGIQIGPVSLGNGSYGKKPMLVDTAGDIILKSNTNAFEASGSSSLGGHVGPAQIAGGRTAKSMQDGATGLTIVPSDAGYDTNSGTWAGLNNFQLIGDLFTVNRAQALTVTFPSTPLEIDIYDTIDTAGKQPVQKILVTLPSTSVPTPALAGATSTSASNNFYTYTSSNQKYYYRGIQGPHYWAFNHDGVIGRFQSAQLINPAWTQDGKGGALYKSAPVQTVADQQRRGRLDTTNAFDNGGYKVSAATLATYGSATGTIGLTPDAYSDVVRTMIPAVGDYRDMAAMAEVQPNMWRPHPMWLAQTQRDPSGLTQVRTIHSYTTQTGDSESGARLAEIPATGSLNQTTGATVQPTGDPSDGSGSVSIPAQQLELVSGAYTDPANALNISQPNANRRQPDLPGDSRWAMAANSFGDFDAGISNAREGPYINKPDEGNYYATSDSRTVNSQTVTKFYRSGYFFNSWRQSDDWRNGVYMTPNRLISSPVMFGSLPTGVWNTGGSVPQTSYALSGSPSTASADPQLNATSFPSRPWQTLLFRPHTPYPQTNTGYTPKTVHPGEVNPKDHYVLDMFFMPVVEPYAISEPLSVAGRINLNYQILPFTNIRRATALHAMIKGEMMTAIPKTMPTPSGSAYGAGKPNEGGIVLAKQFKNFLVNAWDTFYNERGTAPGDTSDFVFFHRPINVTETLRQFDERFSLNPSLDTSVWGPLRSASQICEMHLIPGLVTPYETAASSTNASFISSNLNNLTPSNRQTTMNSFWAQNPATGDNVRERPYSNLYARSTTRSNTFRVHVRSQVLKKARSVAANQFDPIHDTVLSEYRGSAMIERFIDPNDKTHPIPDYAALGASLSGQPALDTFYRFRVLEVKRFNP